MNIIKVKECIEGTVSYKIDVEDIRAALFRAIKDEKVEVILNKGEKPYSLNFFFNEKNICNAIDFCLDEELADIKTIFKYRGRWMFYGDFIRYFVEDYCEEKTRELASFSNKGISFEVHSCDYASITSDWVGK